MSLSDIVTAVVVFVLFKVTAVVALILITFYCWLQMGSIGVEYRTPIIQSQFAVRQTLRFRLEVVVISETSTEKKYMAGKYINSEIPAFRVRNAIPDFRWQ